MFLYVTALVAYWCTEASAALLLSLHTACPSYQLRAVLPKQIDRIDYINLQQNTGNYTHVCRHYTHCFNLKKVFK